MSTRFHDCRRKMSDNMSIQSLHFQLIDIAPLSPIWIQFGEVPLDSLSRSSSDEPSIVASSHPDSPYIWPVHWYFALLHPS